jgi:preprotein translocase subunit YajC
LKQGDALSSLLVIFVSAYFITRVQVNQDGLKLNGTHQFLVYADDVNILGGSVNTIKENADALIVVSKETGVEADADRSKYMVMSRGQNAG